MSDFIDDLYRDNANTIFLADADLNAVKYVKMTEYRRVCAERDRLREALETITEFDNPPRYRVDVNTAYSVAVGAVNIARTALQEDRDG